jgi:hypothetical protein
MPTEAEARELSSQSSLLDLDSGRPAATNERSELDIGDNAIRGRVQRHEIN